MSIATQLQDELYGSGAGGVNLYGDGIFSSICSKGASLLARKGAGLAAKAAAKASARAARRVAANAAKKALSHGARSAKKIAQKQLLRKAGTFARAKIKRATQIAKKRGLQIAKAYNDEIVITDQNSIIKNYKIDTKLLLAPVHESEQKKKFEGHSQPYPFESITWKNLPAFILAAYQVIYHDMGIDDDYFVHWTDLNKSESCDEIKVQIEKTAETGKKTEWVTILIHIPTSSIAIKGQALRNLQKQSW